ncbi:MAG: hypothetical protein JNK64_35305 [Myxococcales bacterium]|nr:hypothetical protein [Myxococcales bacterium]
MTRLIVGNLDCEVAWAGGPALPAAVTARLALLATTLRVFADHDDDRLWLPAPVAPTAVPVDGAPRPRLEHGPLRLAGARRLTAWGALAAPAHDRDHDHAHAHDHAPPPADASWRELVRALPPPPAAIARAASDRRLALALAAELGVALPGARAVASVDELREHLAAGGAAASPTGAWVAKAPLTAAGRDRVRRVGPDVDAATATRLTRLLAVHGALVVEPWMARTLDVGQAGVVLAADRALVLPPHRGVCDSAGVVRALLIDDAAALPPAHARALAAATAAVAARLGALGYRGPFVVDAFAHADGFHPLGEINPRLTFGLVARAWAEHVDQPLLLGLGGPPPPGARALVAAPDGSPAAWAHAGSSSSLSSAVASLSKPSLASR